MELLYISCLDDGSKFESTAICSLTSPLDFFAEIESAVASREEAAERYGLCTMELYCAIGSLRETRKFSRAPTGLLQCCGIDAEPPEHESNDAFEDRFLALHTSALANGFGKYRSSCLKYKLDNDVFLVVRAVWPRSEDKESREELITRVIEDWAQQEDPRIFGFQVVTRSFLLSDLQGRRIIGPLYNPTTDEWDLLLEGSRIVHLREENPYLYERVDYLPVWTEAYIDSIINNPLYAQAIHFEPASVFETWNDAFIYRCVLAPQSGEWPSAQLHELYTTFLSFMRNRLGYTHATEALIPMETFISCQNKRLHRVKGYLQGREESYLSKDFITGITHRTYQLKALEPLFEEVSRKYQSDFSSPVPFDEKQYASLLASCETGGSYDRGLALESVAEYFLSSIEGWRLTGKRIRTINCEIDLCYCNASLDPLFWDMGTILLVECKNRIERTNISDVRNLLYIMQCKGCTTAVLFSYSTFTEVVKDEVYRLALKGYRILLIDKSDLQSISAQNLPEKLLRNKYQTLIVSTENDASLLGYA